MIAISRRSAVEPFHAMDVLATANRMRGEGRNIISMAVGQPADPAPRKVLVAAHSALVDGRIGYTDRLGLPDLRNAISTHYQEHYGMLVDPARVAVTTGSSAAFNHAFLAMFDPGDRVAITRPGYPAYRNIMSALGIEVIEIPVGSIDGHLTAERLADVHRSTPLKGLLFASPANPTGEIIASETLDQLIQKAEELGISVISDEIYHRLNHAGSDRTALQTSDNSVIINSFSKYYCMTGWRIGWMVLPQPLVRPVERVAQSLYISPPEISQRAAIAAFDCDKELDSIRHRYLDNRAILEKRLPKIGFEFASPMDGAFYAWCRTQAHGSDSMELAKRILAETGVAMTPGHDFDPVEGHRHMRLSYAGTTVDMSEAMDRLDRYLNRA